VTTRGIFLGGAGAMLAVSASGARAAAAVAAGSQVTQGALFASLPSPRARQWTRLIMGSGALYQKQIGLGSEVAADGSTRLFYELEVGSPGGSCNPNTLRKAYLRAGRFGSLLDTYPLVSNIGRAANLVFRYGDVTSESSASNDTSLRLLDLPALFDPRTMTVVSVSPQRVHQANREVDTTHVVGEYAASSSHHRLRRIELWHAPSFPFGLVRYRASFEGLEPYELESYSFGDDYKSDLPMSLDRVREITKDDQYGHIPSS
jgi:hypothetical protein